MKEIINTIKNKYYMYQPGEFMPIFIDGKFSNKREFHMYKAKRAVMVLDYKFKRLHRMYQMTVDKQ